MAPGPPNPSRSGSTVSPASRPRWPKGGIWLAMRADDLHLPGRPRCLLGNGRPDYHYERLTTGDAYWPDPRPARGYPRRARGGLRQRPWCQAAAGRGACGCEHASLPPTRIAVVADDLDDIRMCRSAESSLCVGVLTGTGAREELAANGRSCFGEHRQESASATGIDLPAVVGARHRGEPLRSARGPSGRFRDGVRTPWWVAAA